MNLIKVTTSQEGFRRAGRAWHGTTIVDADKLTDVQKEQIKNESTLHISPLTDEEIEAHGSAHAAKAPNEPAKITGKKTAKK